MWQKSNRHFITPGLLAHSHVCSKRGVETFKLEIMENLINRVIAEIKKDFETGDLTALDEMLKSTPVRSLIAYLPEEEWKNFEEVKSNSEKLYTRDQMLYAMGFACGTSGKKELTFEEVKQECVNFIDHL